MEPMRRARRSGRLVTMAYDHDLADRIRGLIPVELDREEKAMFGGLSFLISGNMAVAASGRGGLLVRVDPEQSERLRTRSKGVERMVMGGRSMDGWLLVGADSVRTTRQLSRWVTLGVTYARSLPPKAKTARKATR